MTRCRVHDDHNEELSRLVPWGMNSLGRPGDPPPAIYHGDAAEYCPGSVGCLNMPQFLRADGHRIPQALQRGKPGVIRLNVDRA